MLTIVVYMALVKVFYIEHYVHSLSYQQIEFYHSQPYKGIVYDVSCESGGMFVQSVKFIDEHKGNKKEISVYGQEYTSTTLKLAKMNLTIRGIAANMETKLKVHLQMTFIQI